ncbi:MAG: hypothetical protein QOH24_1831 [Verrucomicrobiota bacterium]
MLKRLRIWCDRCPKIIPRRVPAKHGPGRRFPKLEERDERGERGDRHDSRYSGSFTAYVKHEFRVFGFNTDQGNFEQAFVAKLNAAFYRPPFLARGRKFVVGYRNPQFAAGRRVLIDDNEVIERGIIS